MYDVRKYKMGGNWERKESKMFTETMEYWRAVMRLLHLHPKTKMNEVLLFCVCRKTNKRQTSALWCFEWGGKTYTEWFR